MDRLSDIYKVQIRSMEDVTGTVARAYSNNEFLVLFYSDGRFAAFKAIQNFGGLCGERVVLCDYDLSVPELVKCGLLDVDTALELLSRRQAA